VSERVSEDRLRNVRAWAAARVGELSGADVIVSAIDELLERRRDEEALAPPRFTGNYGGVCRHCEQLMKWHKGVSLDCPS
jgi:hypothetical protein